MKIYGMALLALLVCGAALGEQDATLTQREVRDPRQLETYLEANATDAETRFDALEGATSISLASNKVFIGNGAGKAYGVLVSGDIGITTAGVVSISSAVITNDDIAASASIAATKIANEAVVKTTVFTGDVNGVWNALAITAGSITNTDIDANASIAATKIANEAVVKTTVHTGDVNGVWNALAITADSIVDADINSSAAIAASKISGTALTQSTTFTGDVAGAYNALAIVPGSIVTADLAAAEQASLALADTALQSVANGSITTAKLATAEAASLGLADTALQPADVTGGATITGDAGEAGQLLLTNVIQVTAVDGTTPVSDYTVIRVWVSQTDKGAASTNNIEALTLSTGTAIATVTANASYVYATAAAGTATVVVEGTASSTTNYLMVAVGAIVDSKALVFPTP